MMVIVHSGRPRKTNISTTAMTQKQALKKSVCGQAAHRSRQPIASHVNGEDRRRRRSVRDGVGYSAAADVVISVMEARGEDAGR